MSRTLHELRARDIMATDVQWTTPGDNLLAAGRRMAEHGLRSLLVRGDDPTDLPGIVTSKDIVNLLGTHEPELLAELRVLDGTTVIGVLSSTDIFRRALAEA
jgi:CBS-domain-containing membrane protein